MGSIGWGVLTSVGTGFFGHVFFYPVLAKWHSKRTSRLARMSIGVLLNSIPFLAWLRILKGWVHDDVMRGFLAYCVSFLWNGAGVVLGYIYDDLRK